MTIPIHVTENKSQHRLSPTNVCRVFVDNDYTYGVWIVEQELVQILNPNMDEYLSGDEFKTNASEEQARQLIAAGSTPYTKQVV